MTPTQKTDDYGRVVFDEQDLLELFYKGQSQSTDIIAVDCEAIHAYNNWCKTFDSLEKQFDVSQPLDVTPDEFHDQRQSDWLMPPEYLEIDLDAWFSDRVSTEVERARVKHEMVLFRERGMEDALRLFIYITEALREAGVWWGVGRGSSVASYCLYLIGVHKVDSIKYDLNINEFLK
jgi:DNA polymerase III alpha subunit